LVIGIIRGNQLRQIKVHETAAPLPVRVDAVIHQDRQFTFTFEQELVFLEQPEQFGTLEKGGPWKCLNDSTVVPPNEFTQATIFIEVNFHERPHPSPAPPDPVERHTSSALPGPKGNRRRSAPIPPFGGLVRGDGPFWPECKSGSAFHRIQG
jgi:hypothetical protein